MSAAATSTEIQQGQRGEVGSAAVGVSYVAPDGKSAEIVIAGTGGGGPWELRCDVHPADIVPIGTALVPVVHISPPGAGARGAVGLGDPSGHVPNDTVMLPEGGRLRLDGPSVLVATDITVQAFLPDAQHPTSAILEWLPARYAKENTPASDIKQRDVRDGDSETIGHGTVTVTTIEGVADHHPARLVLRLSRR